MRAAKIIPYVLYIIAFSLVGSLASELETAMSAWSWGFSRRSILSISEILRFFPGYMFYAGLQVVAAVLTIKSLSLKKLFFLSCAFTVGAALLIGFDRQIMDTVGGLFFPLSLMGGLLPYVAPVIILALVGTKKNAAESSPDVGEGAALTSAESGAVTESGTKGKIKALFKRYWYVFDILLIVLAFLYGTLNDPFGIIMYVCGLYNQLAIRAMMTFMWVIWQVPAALCFVVLLLRMIVSWPKYIENRRRLQLLRLLVIAGLGVYSVLPFTSLLPSGIDIYMRGFRHYVEANVNIAGIRNWLGTLRLEDCVVYNITNAQNGTKSSSPKELQKQEWPEVIAKLEPRYVTLSVDDDEHPEVRLNWGSGFLGSWGLTVGNKAMHTPESDISPHGEYREEIRKGAYIWYGMD
jgi:hypothetical protein